MSEEDGWRGPFQLDDRRRTILKWIGVAVVVPAIAAFVLIMIFVARAELAFDESDCPFASVETRDVAPGVRVLDEARTCQEGIVEHRWIVERNGARREIGRRRLSADAYAPDAYRFRVELPGGFVHLTIENDGVEGASFREDAPGPR